MIKALSLLRLLLVSFSQQPGTNVLVVPTKIVVDPTPFRRGQIITTKASFKQQEVFLCPAESPLIRDVSDGFAVRIYGEKDVPTEPAWELSKETMYIKHAVATVAPRAEDNGKKVER